MKHFETQQAHFSLNMLATWCSNENTKTYTCADVGKEVELARIMFLFQACYTNVTLPILPFESNAVLLSFPTSVPCHQSDSQARPPIKGNYNSGIFRAGVSSIRPTASLPRDPVGIFVYVCECCVYRTAPVHPDRCAGAFQHPLHNDYTSSWLDVTVQFFLLREESGCRESGFPGKTDQFLNGKPVHMTWLNRKWCKILELHYFIL